MIITPQAKRYIAKSAFDESQSFLKPSERISWDDLSADQQKSLADNAGETFKQLLQGRSAPVDLETMFEAYKDD